MLVLAISIQGAEYAYNAASAHKVSKASAEKIAAALNKAGYKLKPGQVWYPHTVYYLDNAYAYAENQAFTVYKGSIREKR